MARTDSRQGLHQGIRLSLAAAYCFASLACSPAPITAPLDASSTCGADVQCDDGIFCNGFERCQPASAGADADGCIAGAPPCAEGCDEVSRICVAPCEGPSDADGDGHDSIACGGDDCDDNDARRFPGNPEICDGFHDEDCDPNTVGVRDVDGDGVTDARCCNGVGASAFCGTDCDDGRADRYPGLVEACDGLDNDCDGEIDEGGDRLYYRDADGDGFGDAGMPVGGRCGAPSGTVENNTDCDDSVAARNPGAPEICDGLDNDCDGRVDESVTEVDWYRDADGDGHGDPDAPSVRSCAVQPGFAPRAGDCDDTTPNRHPGVVEACDGIDNDCDGRVDENVGVLVFRDVDGDGFGDPTNTMMACSPPPGYTLSGGDCDDTLRGRNPGVPEVCDGIADNDCDPTTNPFDTDLDGHDAIACGGTDCDDRNATVYPGAPELCDRLDNTCVDGGGVRAVEDADGDGHAPPGVCSGGPMPADDCDDTSAAAFPGQLEVCDGVDNDCDGSTDEDPAAAASCNQTGTVGTCTGGTCSISACSFPYANCDGLGANGCETNLDTHANRCGGCGTPCPVGATCAGGDCFCPAGAQTLCAGRCTNILSDAAHCGGCGSPCPAGATCSAGLCACDSGNTACAGRCVDTLVDTAHCGGCGQPCVGGSCAGGTCTCAGLMPALCGGVCRDVASDTLNCGACGETCFGGSCAGGVCSCGNGETHCDGTCIDTRSDPANCGGCNVSCGLVGGCAASACDGVVDVFAADVSTCVLRELGGFACLSGSSPGYVHSGAGEVRAVRGPVPCVLLADETVRCRYEEVGVAPMWIPLLTEVTQLASSTTGTMCARRRDGTAWCWGRNDYAQVSDVPDFWLRTPVQVPGLADVVAVSTAPLHSCALDATGAVYCWGDNERGQCGVGTTPVIVESPTRFPMPASATHVWATGAVTCARATSGEVYCAGTNRSGDLLGSTGFASSIYTPMRAFGLDAADEIGAGLGAADVSYLCIRVGGSVRCRGSNPFGQLGNGTNSGSREFVTVVDLTDATRLSVGDRQVCSIRSSGAVVCWGHGHHFGNPRDRNVPTSLTGLP